VKIGVTGGTGFVGSTIVSKLLTEGHDITLLVRNIPETGPGEQNNIQYVKGNVVTGEGLGMLVDGKDAVIHLVGIIREAGGNTFDGVHRKGTENVIREAKNAGVRKLVHMSALGTRVNAVSAYHQSKWAGEEAVRSSGLDWTIFRPAIIFGPGDSFINMLADMMMKSPVMPVFGGGKNLMQPVYVDDVARAFSEAVAQSWSTGRVYELGGPNVISFKGILKTISYVIDKKRVFVNIPIAIVRPLVGFFQSTGMTLPVTTDQLIMMQEDNIRQGGDPLDHFSFDFTPFREGIESYLKR
jgi:NADH dehydrogenase